MQPKNQLKASKNLKIIILLLALAIIGSLFFTYKASERSRDEIINLRKDKSELLKELEKSNLFIESLKNGNSKISVKLLAEQKKVQQLIAQLKKANLSPKTIIVYKQKTDSIDGKIIALLNEIEGYKKKIETTSKQLNETSSQLNTIKIKHDTLVTNNKKLASKVTKAEKLYYHELNSNFYKVKSNGKLVETKSASRIDQINFSFKIAENQLAKKTNLTFYIQIIDPKNNVVGDKITEFFGQNTLVYSAKKEFEYDKKTATVKFEIKTINLIKGNYFVTVFEQENQILDSSFILD